MGKRHWPPCVWRTVRSCGGTAAPCRWSMRRRPSGSKRRRSWPTRSARGPKPWRRCVRAKRSTSTNSILRARSGAQAWAHIRRQHVLGVFSPAQQEVLAAFLASLHEREHTPGDISTVPGVEGAAPIAATAACMVARQCQRHFCSVPRQAVPVWLP